MRKFVTMIMAMFLATAMYAKTPVEAKFTVDPPMHCQNCENKIKSNLRFEKGITDINPSAQDGIVTIKYDADKTDPSKIIKSFAKIGYKATLADNLATDKKCSDCKSKSDCCKQKSECCKQK